MNEEFWVRLLLSCALLVTAPAHLLTNPLSPGTDAIGEEERFRQCLIRPGRRKLQMPWPAPRAVGLEPPSEVLGELTAERRSSYVLPYRIATVHAGLGDAASALQ